MDFAQKTGKYILQILCVASKLWYKIKSEKQSPFVIDHCKKLPAKFHLQSHYPVLPQYLPFLYLRSFLQDELLWMLSTITLGLVFLLLTATLFVRHLFSVLHAKCFNILVIYAR